MSMGDTTRFLCFLFSLCLVTKGSTQSSRRWPPSVVDIEQFPTGRKLESKTEWKVNITNTCACTILHLKLLCPKFQSRVEVDSSIISKSDINHCLVNNGLPLHARTSLSFTYVWDHIDFG